MEDTINQETEKRDDDIFIKLLEHSMQEILVRLDSIERQVASLMRRDVKEVQYHEGERLYDNQELCEILKISMRSLQRYRSDGELQSIRMKRITYYKHSEVERFRTHCFNEEINKIKSKPASKTKRKTKKK